MVTTLKYGSQKDSLNKLLSRLYKNSGKGIDAQKYSGKLVLTVDPLSIQKKLRYEWE